jgi:hypothetical protein
MTDLSDDASTITTRLLLYRRGTLLGPATGFFKEGGGGRHFLITNWHVVSGRHQETKNVLHSQGALPDRLRFTVPERGRIGEGWLRPLNACCTRIQILTIRLKGPLGLNILSIATKWTLSLYRFRFPPMGRCVQ